MACLKFNAKKNGSTDYAGVKEIVAVFVAGRFDQFIEIPEGPMRRRDLRAVSGIAKTAAMTPAPAKPQRRSILGLDVKGVQHAMKNRREDHACRDDDDET